MANHGPSTERPTYLFEPLGPSGNPASAHVPPELLSYGTARRLTGTNHTGAVAGHT